jgi:hypothetical protein
VELLDLTADQRKQLADLEAETKAKIEKILTPEQLEKMKQLPPPRMGGPGGRPGQPGGPGGSGVEGRRGGPGGPGGPPGQGGDARPQRPDVEK